MGTGAVRSALTMAVAVVMLLMAGPAAANTITVTTTQDEVSNDGACSLREAIMVADNPGNPMDCTPASQSVANTVVLGPHTYALTIPHKSDDGSSGHLAMFTILTLTIQGGGPRTVIDASGLNDRVVTVSPGASASLQDLTIMGGHAPDGAAGSPGQPVLNSNGTAGGTGGTGADGGGVANSGTLTVDHVTITGNRAGNGGRGGDGGAGPEDFVHQGGTGGTGGAGGAGGGIYNNGVLTVRDSTINGNHAGDGGNGGLGGFPGTPSGHYGGTGGAGGAGGDGGGIASVGSANSLTVIASTVNGNFAGNSGAGGDGAPAPDMLGTYKGGNAGNGANGALGGGISDLSSAVSISNSTITGNTAGAGGASGSPGIGWPQSFENLGLPGTYGSGGDGGGLRITNPAGASVASDTIAGNVAPAPLFETPGQGGGIWEQSPATLIDTLLASNSPGGNCGTDSGSVASEFLDGGHDLGFGDSTCPASFATGDPKLKPLGNNGGPTSTMALSPGSAAADQVPASGAGCPPTDQRGASRPAGSACDIGAYELAPPVVANPSAGSITTSAASLNGSVTAEAPDATVHFEFGTTTSYGSVASAPDVAGFSAQPVSAALQGLLPGTTYHFRLVASSQDGTTQSADETFTTAGGSSPPPPPPPPPPKQTRTPVLTNLRISPRHFHRGATISYTDSRAATTTLVVWRCVRRARRTHRCTRFARAGAFTHRDVAGRNQLRFSGRLGSRKLAPGRFRLDATPRLKRLTGRTVSVGFTITR